MIEIHPQPFVGSELDYEMSTGRFGEGWAVVHACKEPYRRQALGYTARGAQNTHPEYLIVRKGNRLILNLVDAPDPAYIPDEIMDAAIEFIHSQLAGDQRVLVCTATKTCLDRLESRCCFSSRIQIASRVSLSNRPLPLSAPSIRRFLRRRASRAGCASGGLGEPFGAVQKFSPYGAVLPQVSLNRRYFRYPESRDLS